MLWVDSAGEDVVVDKQSVLPVKAQLGVVVDLFKRTISGWQIIYEPVNINAVIAMTAGQ